MEKIVKLLLAIILVAGSNQAHGDDGNLSGHYWFDNSTELIPFIPGQSNIPTMGLKDGFHVLNLFVERNGVQSSAVSTIFLKSTFANVEEIWSAMLFIDGTYYQTVDISNGIKGGVSLSLDLNDVSVGLHTLGVQLVTVSGHATDLHESMFVRMPSDIQLAEMRGYYFIDGKTAGEIELTKVGNILHLDIDASTLSPGLHSVDVFAGSPMGISTSVASSWFIKTPLGGEGVKAYRYWINDDIDSMERVILDEVANPFNLIKLIDIQEAPFRSSSYSFDFVDGAPVVYSKNDFNIIFSDGEGGISTDSHPFIDTRVKYEIGEIEPIGERDQLTIPEIKDNTMKWFSFEAEQGDSLALSLDRGAMYDVYSPDAELILSKTGADAMSSSGTALMKTGKYYIAVHDISGCNKTNTQVYFEHIPRFALLSSTPVKAGAKGLLRIDLRGNGFDKLKHLSLSNGVNTIVLDELVNIDSRYDLTVKLNIDLMKLSLGQYDLIAIFDDEGDTLTITKADAIEFVTASKAEVKVEVITPRVARTPYQMYVDVTNTSDQSCWGVPLNIAVADTEKGVGVELIDFIPVDGEDDIVSTELPDYFITDNLLGNGETGMMTPIFIPYLGPKETIRFTLGLYSEPHDFVPVYAWSGQPWSEEFEELMAEDFDVEQLQDYEATNVLTARELCYLELYGDEEESEPDIIRNIQSKQESSNSRISNVYYKAAAEAERQFNLMRTEQYRSPGHIIMPFGHTIAQEFFNVDRFFRLYPTVKKIKIKVVKKGSGSSSDGNKSAAKKATISTPNPKLNLVDCCQSGDPNDMSGYLSPSGDRYIGVDVKTINYTIEFENDPEIATASASVIVVDNDLDGKRHDLATFKPLTLKIGDKETDLPAAHHFVKTLDMRPTINAIAELTFDYDSTSGHASWNLRSLNPMTMEPTKYMDDGILPVNDDSNRGVGYLTYSVDILPSLSHGDEISNSATIVFDDNEPIKTPVWVNTLDLTLPQARIVDQSTDDGITFNFTVEGSDTGAGIWIYDLYARQGASGGWKIVKANIEDDIFSFTADRSMSDYQFAVVATDRAGNRQNEDEMNGLAGDADGNGQINAADVVLTRNYYTGVTKAINFNNADVTLDGSINAQDAIAIRNLYLDVSVKKNQYKRLNCKKQ